LSTRFITTIRNPLNTSFTNILTAHHLMVFCPRLCGIAPHVSA
jgi:hypothetical protein